MQPWSVKQGSVEKRRQEVLDSARGQGTLTSEDRVTIWDETGVVVGIRQRDSGPHRGKRVLTCTATADVDESSVDLALEMARRIIGQGSGPQQFGSHAVWQH